MKRNRKSAIIRGLIFAAGLTGISACDSTRNIEWPHIYGPNEIPAAVIDEPRAVTTPPPVAADATFPRLGDVPPKPKNFTPQPVINQTKQQMEADRAEAQAIKQQIEPQTPAQQP